MTSIMKILQNFVKLACLEVAFLKIGFFGILICNLQMVNNFMVIRPVVSEILGGLGTIPIHPPDASKLSKRADAINS